MTDLLGWQGGHDPSLVSEALIRRKGVNKKERLLAAVHRKRVDRVPTTFRATKPLTLRTHEAFCD